MINSVRSKRYALALVAFVVACVPAVALRLAAAGSLTSGVAGTPAEDLRTETPWDAIPMTPIGSDPFIDGGTVTTLAVAQTQAGFAVAIPNSSAASPSLKTDVWIGPAGLREGASAASGTSVVLEYPTTGVRIDERPMTALESANPEGALRQDAVTFQLPFSDLVTLGDATALVFPSQGRGVTIDMYRDGVFIMLIGPPSMSVSDLSAVGASLS